MTSSTIQQIGPTARVSIPGTGNAVPVSITFTADSATAVVNCQNMPNSQGIQRIAAIQVSNQNVPVPIELFFPDTGLTQEVPPFSSGPIQALTNGLVVTVSSPAQALINGSTTVNLTLLDFPMQPNLQPAARAQKDAAFNTTFDFAASASPQATVPGTGLLFNTVYASNTGTGTALVLKGAAAADGAPWGIGIPALTAGEFGIPLTQSGSTVTLSGAQSIADVPVNWRTEPQGSGVSYNQPENLTGFTATVPLVTGGTGGSGVISGDVIPAVAGKGIIANTVILTPFQASSSANDTISVYIFGGPQILIDSVQLSSTQLSGVIAQQFVGPLLTTTRGIPWQYIITVGTGSIGGYMQVTIYGQYVDGSAQG